MKEQKLNVWHERSDAELVAASANDAEAFGVFYDRYVHSLLVFFTRRTGDPNIAADLTAETFAQAFISRARYRDTGAPAQAWLIRIARRQLSRFLRHKKMDERARRRLGVPQVALDDLSYERIEALADLAPMREAIREAMRSLSPKLANAVALRVGLELPYSEVAARLRCSEGAARVRVARGLSRLADILEMLP